jgi:hypothetical protein
MRMQNPLLRLIQRQYPLWAVDSALPVYRLYARRLPWAADDERLSRTTRAGIAAGCAVSMTVAGGLLLINHVAQGPDRPGEFDRVTPLITVWGFIFLVNVLLSLFMDVRAALAGYEQYRLRIGDPGSELLLMTPVRRADLIRAWHALAQVQTWRLFAWIMGVRVSLCFLGVGVALALLAVSDLPVLIFLAGLVYLACAAFLLLAEPVVRLQTFAALGMAARAGSISGAGLFTLSGLLVLVWMLALAALPLGFLPPVFFLLPLAAQLGLWALVRRIAIRRVARFVAVAQA